MEFKSYKSQVMAAMKLCKKEFCEGVGVLAVAEVQSVTPVLSGNLKKSIVSEVMPNNEGINIGVTPAAPYGLYVEKGIGQTAQPFLEPGAMNAIPKITSVAEQIYRKMGG
jgi:hypothetical protein